MILVDANLLLYAHNSSTEQHEKARVWLEEVFSGHEPVGLSWPTILAFLRITTNPRLPHPLSRAEAMQIVSEWLERPQAVLVGPGENHWEILQHLLSAGKATGSLVMDAHLATIAIEHGATLYTTDRDFARFPKLRFRNPIEEI